MWRQATKKRVIYLGILLVNLREAEDEKTLCRPRDDKLHFTFYFPPGCFPPTLNIDMLALCFFAPVSAFFTLLSFHPKKENRINDDGH